MGLVGDDEDKIRESAALLAGYYLQSSPKRDYPPGLRILSMIASTEEDSIAVDSDAARILLDSMLPLIEPHMITYWKAGRPDSVAPELIKVFGDISLKYSILDDKYLEGLKGIIFHYNPYSNTDPDIRVGAASSWFKCHEARGTTIDSEDPDIKSQLLGLADSASMDGNIYLKKKLLSLYGREYLEYRFVNNIGSYVKGPFNSDVIEDANVLTEVGSYAPRRVHGVREVLRETIEELIKSPPGFFNREKNLLSHIALTLAKLDYNECVRVIGDVESISLKVLGGNFETTRGMEEVRGQVSKGDLEKLSEAVPPEDITAIKGALAYHTSTNLKPPQRATMDFCLKGLENMRSYLTELNK